MMSRSHAMCGLIAGATVAAGLLALDDVPLLLRAELVPAFGGAALLPDIDTRQSRAARSLGPVTQLLGASVAALARVVYHATRTERDSPGDNGGHRRLTHTIPGCLIFGAIVALAVWGHPIAGAVALALLCGLLAQTFRAIGIIFTLVFGANGYWCLTHYSSWSWIWPLVVALGAFVHILGDTVTNSGTPLLWPLLRDGKRWGKVRTWATFATNGAIECGIVTVALVFGVVVSLAFAAGLAQPVVGAIVARVTS